MTGPGGAVAVDGGPVPGCRDTVDIPGGTGH